MSYDTSYLDVMLSSENLTDLISNYYLVSELATYDAELLEKIQKEIPVKIIVAHVNHHVRKEAITEEEYIKKYCQNHQIICEVANLKPVKNNFEAVAHEFRYAFFKKLIKKY